MVEKIKEILSKFNIIFGMNTWDKVGFEDTDIDLTNEPEGNLHAIRWFPDSISRGPEGDTFDATCAISYPNDKQKLIDALKELDSIAKFSFPAVTIRWILQDWDSEVQGPMPI